MTKLYTIKSKRIPTIWDRGTEYMPSQPCEICGAVPSIILKLGVYLPSFDKPFGLVEALGGLVVSEEGIQYFIDNGINCFEKGEVNIVFVKRKNIVEKYYWIKPTHQVEIDNITGPDICDSCHIGRWKEEDWEIRKIKGDIPADFFQIKYSWFLLVTDKFKKVAQNIPGGCFVNFEKWE